MTVTIKQAKAAQKILNNNPSMRWNGKFGHYSNGVAVMNIYWEFDEHKEKFKIKL